MPEDKNSFLTIVDELVAEEVEVMEELIQEEIMPLIKYRQELERKISTKAIADMYKAEEEA